MLDWLTEKIMAAISGDISALFELLNILNVGWLGFKGILVALQGLKILYQEVLGGLGGNAARGRRQRMNTLGAEVRATAVTLMKLEGAKIGVVKGGGKVVQALAAATKPITA